MSWLARLKNLQTPEGHATKPTEPGFVGFVAPPLGVSENSGVVVAPLRLRQQKSLQTPEGHATKPTEPGFVGFVAPPPGASENSNVVVAPLLLRPKNLQTLGKHATKPTEPVFVVARACADCQHFGPRGTCFAPLGAGLRTEQEGFGIAWPEEGQATTCTVFSAKAPELAQDRPHKLTREQLHAAHAEPWSEAVIVRFQARTAAIQRHGFGEQDAEDLAERLHLRDVDCDDRVLCVECSHYRRGRCGSHAAAGLHSPKLSRDLTVTFQRCAGFEPAARRI